MTKNELAIQEFRNGFNCAQSVIAVYSDELKIDKELALRISAGFGSGMGRLQSTCGAVTGAFMTIGAFVSNKFEKNADRKAKSIAMIQSYNEKFLALNKTSECKDLLGCNLKTPEGQATFKDNNLSEKVCEKCISDSIDILNQLFSSIN